MTHGGAFDPERGRELMIAYVADRQNRLYHEVARELAVIEDEYGRRAALHDLILAFEVGQERTKKEQEEIKSRSRRQPRSRKRR